MANLRAGLIGLGMMGRNHARVLRGLSGVDLVGVADPGGDPHKVAGSLDVLPDMSPEALEAEARSLLPDELDDDPEVLVMTDVFGATPSNIAQRLVDGNRVRALAGVNVPMLWRTLNYAGRARLDELFARAVQGGAQGVLPIASTRPQNQAFLPGAHDQDHHHHQQ